MRILVLQSFDESAGCRLAEIRFDFREHRSQNYFDTRYSAKSGSKTERETYFDFVTFVCTHYEIMGYSAWLEFTGHTEGEGVTSGLAGTFAHHERSFRLLAQYLQRYLSGITVRIVNDR